MTVYIDTLKARPPFTLEYPTAYDRARGEYAKLVNEYSQEYHSSRKGRAYAEAWVDELFPDGIADLTWEQIYWDLRTHREHPPECSCTGFNNPTGCPVCRVSARVEFNVPVHTRILADTRANE